MVRRFLFLFSLAAYFVHFSQAAALGPQCFSYESFAHDPFAAPPAFNAALQNYPYGTIQNRGAALFAALAGVAAAPAPIAFVSMSFGNGPLGAPWQHAMLHVNALTIREAAQVVLNRRQIQGIPVRFQNIAAVIATAALPVGVAAAPPVIAALRSGGYLMPLAAILHRLRMGLVPGLFAAAPMVLPPDYIVLHIHLEKRVSKNLKELSYNSLTNPPVIPAGGYATIKNMIDAPFAGLAPAPHSATIVSSEHLQND